MKHIERALGWLYIRHTLMAPATLFMLLFGAFCAWLYHNVFDEQPPLWATVAFGLPFYICDIIYNAICGTFIFLELPREWVYTNRVARHRVSPYEGTALFARHVCMVLDYFDPGHCDKADVD